ncbi:MAG: sigma-54-dependent Fis family transcriptional regulator [Nitrospirae bacterium]|nr:sigma-54-dependent Fis family transcriptional regulator [Nitrospirota bacterium]
MTKAVKGKVLVVDDQKSIREILEIFLKSEGFSVSAADNGMTALDIMKNDIFDLVITDMKMPKLNGIDLLRNIKEIAPNTIVVIITAFGTPESAVEAMKLGAFDYIQKPFKMDDIRLVIKNAFEKKRLQTDLSILKEQLGTASFENMIGQSPAMLELFSMITKYASSGANVLITGESGTGKELIAKAVYNLSPRKTGRFVTLNCAAIPEGLLESELFGYMKGAFSGAVSNKEGLFELADEGTIFLDEIAEMPVALQAKLLRVIEDGTFRRVGSTSDVKVDVRIISATNKNLLALISEGRFREDLYFRLNVLSLKIPPLRERREDIPLLVDNFIKKYAGGKKQISQDAIEVLMHYMWKGNVRELENIIERALLLHDSEVIDSQHLPEEIRTASPAGEHVAIPSGGINFEGIIEDMEKAYLKEALEKAHGIKTDAAKLLSLSFHSFRHRLKKYGIDK